MDLHTPFPIPSTPPRPPVPLLSRQESLQGVLDFTALPGLTPPATPHQASRALLLYCTILEDCKRDNLPLSSKSSPKSFTPLHPFFLALHEHCPAPGKSNILFVVLHALFPPPLPEEFTSWKQRAPDVVLQRAESWLQPSFKKLERNRVYRNLQILADDLLRGFFVPLLAAGGQTSGAVSPLICERSHGDVGSEQGTLARLNSLRDLCLSRDDNRCVITRRIDWSVMKRYNEKHPDNPIDEDTAKVEVAHIIPHYLNTLSADGTLGPSRTYAWRVMNMFDPGISNQLATEAIDSPRNAMSLDSQLHQRFGRLTWYFEPIGLPGSHTYTFHAVRGQRVESWLRPPTGVVSFNTSSDVPPPDPRILALHRACCLMLSMSGGGACADQILHGTADLRANGVLAADGSSDLAMFWKLRDLGATVLAY